MSQTITGEQFREQLMYVLEECFEQVQGIFLDRGTSLFETLETISAEEASTPVSTTCASIAAQIGHVQYYLDQLEGFLKHEPQGRADWPGSWRTGPVTSAQWDAQKQRLRATYRRLADMIRGYDAWDTEDAMGGAIGLVAHSAYHLGEIRQALCTIKTLAPPWS